MVEKLRRDRTSGSSTMETQSKLERFIMDYFLKYISAVEIVAIIGMREEIKRMGNPDLVLEFGNVVIEMEISKAHTSLVKKDLLEYMSGCYNLALQLREELMKKPGILKPGFSKNLEELIE